MRHTGDLGVRRDGTAGARTEDARVQAGDAAELRLGGGVPLRGEAGALRAPQQGAVVPHADHRLVMAAQSRASAAQALLDLGGVLARGGEADRRQGDVAELRLGGVPLHVVARLVRRNQDGVRAQEPSPLLQLHRSRKTQKLKALKRRVRTTTRLNNKFLIIRLNEEISKAQKEKSPHPPVLMFQ